MYASAHVSERIVMKLRSDQFQSILRREIRSVLCHMCTVYYLACTHLLIHTVNDKHTISGCVMFSWQCSLSNSYCMYIYVYICSFFDFKDNAVGELAARLANDARRYMYFLYLHACKQLYQ